MTYKEMLQLLKESPQEFERISVVYDIEMGDTVEYKLKNGDKGEYWMGLYANSPMYNFVNATGRVYAQDGGWRWIPNEN